MRGASGPGGREAPWADDANIMAEGGFFPGRQPLSRTGYSRGTRRLERRSPANRRLP